MAGCLPGSEGDVGRQTAEQRTTPAPLFTPLAGRGAPPFSALRVSAKEVLAAKTVTGSLTTTITHRYHPQAFHFPDSLSVKTGTLKVPGITYFFISSFSQFLHLDGDFVYAPQLLQP